jgi:hypothetical protein
MNFMLFRVLSVLLLTSVLAYHEPINPAKYPALVPAVCIGDSITQYFGTCPGFPYQDPVEKLLGEHWRSGIFRGGRTLLRQGNSHYCKEIALADTQNFRPGVIIILLDTNYTLLQN